MKTREQDYENLIYLNRERIRIKNSKEYFLGKKLLKYLKLLKNFQLIMLFKELCHDVYAFLNKDTSNNVIVDFNLTAKRKFEKKIVVYTCIYGKYDEILEPLCVDNNCEYYIFTDSEIKEGSIWKKGNESLFPPECNTAAKRNRYIKMFPYKFFDCEYSIYLDGNLQLVGYPSLLIQKNIDGCKTGIAMHLAPRENCIYEEARTVCLVGKINKKERNQVLLMYKENNMPRHFGMFECNVIVRNHNNENLKTIMEYWWQQYSHGVKRDQLYFTFSLYKLGFCFEDVINFGASVNDNELFIRHEHK